MDDLINRQAAMDELERGKDKKAKGAVGGFYNQIIDNDIEKLRRLPSAKPKEDIRAMCGECDAWNQYKKYPQPRWIPCSTALPKTEEKVLITCEHLDIYGKPHWYVCKAFHVDRYTMRSDVDWWDEGCDEYHEEDDQYYVLEGWYEYIHNWGDYSAVRIMEDKVVAWMELPKPWEGR